MSKLQVFKIRHPGFKVSPRVHWNRFRATLARHLWTPWTRVFDIEWRGIDGSHRRDIIRRHSMMAAINAAHSARRGREVIAVHRLGRSGSGYFEIFDPHGEPDMSAA